MRFACPTLTNSNPNRPLGIPPQLDADIYPLPWLRGYLSQGKLLDRAAANEARDAQAMQRLAA